MFREYNIIYKKGTCIYNINLYKKGPYDIIDDILINIYIKWLQSVITGPLDITELCPQL